MLPDDTGQDKGSMRQSQASLFSKDDRVIARRVRRVEADAGPLA